MTKQHKASGTGSTKYYSRSTGSKPGFFLDTYGKTGMAPSWTSLANQYAAKQSDSWKYYTTNQFVHDSSKGDSWIQWYLHPTDQILYLIQNVAVPTGQRLVIDQVICEAEYWFNSASKFLPMEVTPFAVIAADGATFATVQKTTADVTTANWPRLIEAGIDSDYQLVKVGNTVRGKEQIQTFYAESTLNYRYSQHLAVEFDVTDLAKQWVKRYYREVAEAESSFPGMRAGLFFALKPGNQTVNFNTAHRILYHFESNTHLKL